MVKVKPNLSWSSAWGFLVYTVGKEGQRQSKKSPFPQRSQRLFFQKKNPSESKYFKITPLMCLLTASLSQRKFLMPFYPCHYTHHIWLRSCLMAMIWWVWSDFNQYWKKMLNKYSICVFVIQNNENIVCRFLLITRCPPGRCCFIWLFRWQ